MKLRYHAIQRDLFDALAAGGGGPQAIMVLAEAEHSKHLTLLRGVSFAARQADSMQAACARRGLEVLATAERQDGNAAASVVRYPAVCAWAVRTLRSFAAHGRDQQEAQPGRLAEIAAAAAVRARLDVEIPVFPIAGVVSLPSLGTAQVNADLAIVRSSPGRAEIRWARGRVEISTDTRRDAPGWLCTRSCQAGSLKPVIEDMHPFRMPAATGLAPRLTEREARDWKEILQQGWHVLAVGHPAIAAEVAAAISVIVPLSASDHGQLSSSSPETFGAVAMSKPSDPTTCAVTLTHELQHLKLCATLDIVRLTQADDGRRYYAPWRADPRPVAGLLQGAYAYLGVTQFWRRQRQLVTGAAGIRADSEFAQWRAGTVRAIDSLLSSRQLTDHGSAFVRRMAETADEWMSESVSPEARAIAGHKSRSHLSHWELRNGPVPA